MIKVERILEPSEGVSLKTTPVALTDHVSEGSSSLIAAETGVDRDLLRLECLQLALKHPTFGDAGVIGYATALFQFVTGADRAAEEAAREATLAKLTSDVVAAAEWAVGYAWKTAVEKGGDEGVEWLRYCLKHDLGEVFAKASSSPSQ